jgi:hypothetical protein
MSEPAECPLCDARLDDARSVAAHLPRCPAELDVREGWSS